MPLLRQKTLRMSHQVLALIAWEWRSVAVKSGLRCYGYRHGVAHLLQIGLIEQAKTLLQDFAWLMARFEAEGGSGAFSLSRDAEAVLVLLPQAGKENFQIWAAFFRERAHILRRGTPAWGTHKILLQLASEHADDSPVTQVAEAWLEQGGCDWFWLRRARRVAKVSSSNCLRVLEGHEAWVWGAALLSHNRILSWSYDQSLRIWDGVGGENIAILEGHTKVVRGAQVLSDERILSWSPDCSLRIWDGGTGENIAVLEGHTKAVYGALELADGRILSWSGDKTLRIWDLESGESLSILVGHKDGVKGALKLSDGRILSWSGDKTLRTWDLESGESLSILVGHKGDVNGVLELSDGRILSWSRDKTLRIWDLESGENLSTLVGHKGGVNGALKLSDGRILSWSGDKTLRIWDLECGTTIINLHGHTKAVDGAQVLSEERILSWSSDGTLRLWDAQSGETLRVVQQKLAALVASDLFSCWVQSSNSRAHDGSTACAGHQGGISLFLGSDAVFWQANGNWKAEVLLFDQVVASCTKDLAFLRLYHGSHRVRIRNRQDKS